eukprot:3139421-Karenia_brevis.AAC.1
MRQGYVGRAIEKSCSKVAAFHTNIHTATSNFPKKGGKNCCPLLHLAIVMSKLGGCKTIAVVVFVVVDVVVVVVVVVIVC